MLEKKHQLTALNVNFMTCIESFFIEILFYFQKSLKNEGSRFSVKYRHNENICHIMQMSVVHKF